MCEIKLLVIRLRIQKICLGYLFIIFFKIVGKDVISYQVIIYYLSKYEEYWNIKGDDIICVLLEDMM